VDFVLFTSRRQVEQMMRTARELGLADAVLDRARRLVVVASIGPICTDALRRHGLPVDLEPEHSKMGHLVVAVARRQRELLEAKRAARNRHPVERADAFSPGRGAARPATGAHPWPRREHENEPRVAQRAHRPALVGLEVREETAATGHAAAVLGHLDLAIADVQVRALVDVMLL
jgi:hypothetical protein